MKLFSSASEWLGVSTNVAVIIGLALVVLELNQNSDLARIQLVNEGNSAENELFMALMESVPKESVTKSLECPEKLDLSDYVVLDSYIYTGMNLVYRNFELAKESFFSEKDWKSEVDIYAHWYLSGEFGRTYWKTVGRNYFDSEFSAYVDTVLTKPGIDMEGAWRAVASAMPSKNATAHEISSICTSQK